MYLLDYIYNIFFMRGKSFLHSPPKTLPSGAPGYRLGRMNIACRTTTAAPFVTRVAVRSLLALSHGAMRCSRMNRLLVLLEDRDVVAPAEGACGDDGEPGRCSARPGRPRQLAPPRGPPLTAAAPLLVHGLPPSWLLAHAFMQRLCAAAAMRMERQCGLPGEWTAEATIPWHPVPFSPFAAH